MSAILIFLQWISKFKIFDNFSQNCAQTFAVFMIPYMFCVELFVVVPHFMTYDSPKFILLFCITLFLLFNLVVNLYNLIRTNTSIQGLEIPTSLIKYPSQSIAAVSPSPHNSLYSTHISAQSPPVNGYPPSVNGHTSRHSLTVANTAAVASAANLPPHLQWGALAGDWRFCTACEAYCPPRSFHCRSCRVCVLRRDHHCLFAANCVGALNHRYFMATLLYYLVLCALASSYNLPFVMRIMYADRTLKSALFCTFLPLFACVCGLLSVYELVLGFSCISVFVSGVLLAVMLVYHASLLCHNTTVWESHHSAEARARLHLGSWRRNVAAVLGRRWMLAMVWPLLPNEFSKINYFSRCFATDMTGSDAANAAAAASRSTPVVGMAAGGAAGDYANYNNGMSTIY